MGVLNAVPALPTWDDVVKYALDHPKLATGFLILSLLVLEWIKAGYQPEVLKKRK